MTEPLVGPPYRLFFAAQVISSTGSAVAPIALAFAILGIGGGGSGIALVLGTEFVIYTLLLPLTGVIADRTAGVGALVSSQVIAAVFQMTEAVLIISGSATVWSLAIVASGGAAGAALFTPIGQRVIPQLVPVDQLNRANALSQTARHGIAVIGPVSGGMLVATAGPGWGICWDSITFAVAAIMFARLPLAAGMSSCARPARWPAGLADGWRALGSRTWLWSMTFSQCVGGAAFMAALVIGPAYARQHLNGALGWGLINSCLAGGTAAGGILAAAWTTRRPGILISLCMAGMPLGCWAAGLGLPLPVILLATAIAGAVYGPAGVTRQTLIQQHIPHQELGRVSANIELAESIPVPIAYAIAGTAADRLGTQMVMTACAAVIATASLIPLAVRDVRQLSLLPTDSP
ncbi:MFS transporter [Actinoallomurus sp. NBC_01490]|uniref:MFS transporter n=1 Tax=Actinoallomurus sp. NBC_01490 TaxID=2903557 RepID=UPI002E36B85D|nr:MFS transporter [Actinoallomurus sp. NBC_01490]